MNTKLLDNNTEQTQQGNVKLFNPADLEHSGTKQSKDVQAAVEEDNKPITTYQDIFKELNPHPSEAEQEEERKRQRRNAVIAAIGDGISALANLHYTTKGAPSSYDPKLGLSAKLQERYDKLNAERKAHEKEWRAGFMRAQALDRQAEKDRNNWKLMRRKLDVRNEQWQREQEAKASAQAAKEAEANRKLDIAQQNADTRRKQADDKAAGRGGYARSGGRGGSNVEKTVDTYDRHGNLRKTVVTSPGNKQQKREQRRGSLLPGNKKTKGSLLPKK